MTRRVLWICEYARLNGAERSLLATLSGLRSSGYDVAAVGPATGPLAEELARAAVPLTPVEWHDAAGRRIALDDVRAELERCIGSLAPGLVHANSLSMARIAGPVVQSLGVPGIGHIRDIVGLSRTAIADVNRNARLLCVSAATRDFHVAQGLDPDRAHVLHNGVDLEEFRPRTATGRLHTELGLEPTTRLLTTIGQIGARKGQDVVLAALPDIVAAAPDVHLLIVGERCSQKAETVEYERQLLAAADASGLSPHVHFLGVREDVARILNETAVLVHAARQEPLGRVLLEAAASGCAVVATDVGGTAEIFATVAPSAVLIKPNNSRLLAEEVLRLLEDDERRGRLAAEAKLRATAAFDRRTTARQLALHYDAVIDTASR
ncbi:MAG: glycosyltransferase family 4 protein [Planctomycetales bacterium]|nr:glycosyltransferase family 4 protein [Planctomycetales bacterium]